MIRPLVAAVLALSSLSACNGVAGAVGQSMASQAIATQMGTGPGPNGWMDRAERLNCAQLATELPSARSTAANPLTGGPYRPYVARLEAQYAALNCG